MSDVADKLRAAKALIEDPKHWTTGQWARNAKRRAVTPSSDRAVCWCAEGALLHALRAPDWTKADLIFWDALRKGARRLGDIVETNDNEGHAAVMAMYDRAIAKAEGAS